MEEYSDLSLTVSPSPHIKHTERTRSIMYDVAIALFPAILFGVYNFGLRVLTLTVISVLSCIGFEALWQALRKQPLRISDGSSLVTGLLLACNLPVLFLLTCPAIRSPLPNTAADFPASCITDFRLSPLRLPWTA